MAFRRFAQIPIVLAAVCSVVVAPVSAGSVNLLWNPSSGATSYKVYSGTSSGSYGAPLTLGNVTQTTFSTMADCTATFFAVTASNAAGESGYSNEISSWPRPTLTGANPTGAARGATVSVVISGNNFQSGATVQTTTSGVTVNSSTRNACGQITASLTIGASAAIGPVSLSVVNPNGVTGTASGLFSVQGTPLPDVPNLRRTDKQ